MTHRPGRLAPDWITSMVMPEELEARIALGGVASSISANNFALKSGRSGAFSWTKSALASAAAIFDTKVNRSREALGDSPFLLRVFQAASIYFRRLASAFGAGSDAITLIPCVR